MLSMFFETGPVTRYNLNKKLKTESEKFQGENKQNFSFKHGKSFNKNLDALVQLKLLQHIESYKKSSKIKHDEIGESLYRLTIWGVIVHLRNENKLSPFQINITNNEVETPIESTLTDEDLDKVLPHLKDFPISIPDIIQRKWDYLYQNTKEIAYDRLYDALLLANYYYEWLNADFVGFEKSALKDILLHFLLPYRSTQSCADNWIKSIVKDREIFDLVVDCFCELKEQYKLNQEIIAEYGKILRQARNGKKLKVPKFLNDNYEFMVKVPSYFGKNHYIGRGPWGYRLSYVLNELNSDPIRYTSSLLETHKNYRIKRRGIRTKSHSINKQRMS
ncbi:MAG: hypothetical protein HYR87_01430 [Thaumarchaeota archaeon]|nr:hypothetical protein [Nitrososphaerota archaeon]